AIIFGRTTSPIHNLLSALHNIWSLIFLHFYGPYSILKRKRKEEGRIIFNIYNMTDASRIEMFELEVGGRIGEDFIVFLFLLLLFFFFTPFIFLFIFSIFFAIGEFYRMLTSSVLFYMWSYNFILFISESSKKS